MKTRHFLYFFLLLSLAISGCEDRGQALPGVNQYGGISYQSGPDRFGKLEKILRHYDAKERLRGEERTPFAEVGENLGFVFQAVEYDQAGKLRTDRRQMAPKLIKKYGYDLEIRHHNERGEIISYEFFYTPQKTAQTGVSRSQLVYSEDRKSKKIHHYNAQGQEVEPQKP